MLHGFTVLIEFQFVNFFLIIFSAKLFFVHSEEPMTSFLIQYSRENEV